MNQWLVAATQPENLRAMCVWEGASDFYRDASHHGGILSTFWEHWYDKQVKTVQYGLGERGPRHPVTGQLACGDETLSEEELAANRADFGAEVRDHPFIDQYHLDRTPDWDKITVPLLTAGNWGGRRGSTTRIDEPGGERKRFASAISPAWSRKSPRVAEVLPLLYLHGLSSSDFGPALEQFLGSGAGLSAATITRLTTQWQEEAAAFGTRSLVGTDYVYVWVDGIHLKVRLQQDKVCLLVMIGVRADGRKELIALTDGFRESTESWADLLRSARRGMTAPVLAVGDGALGFWAAVREVFPGTREHRCWFHKTATDTATDDPEPGVTPLQGTSSPTTKTCPPWDRAKPG